MLSAGKTEVRPARRIGKYLITGRIGRGGMGYVYRGLDQMLEREVAVKTLTVEGTYDDESRKRFEIEAKAAAKLQHPNIVTVFELGEDRGSPFIAMELLPGADLETLLRGQEPLLLQEKLQILIQVCRGLAYAHEHHIVHRDIKPSNIRVLEDGTAKIMDFGIAKLAGTGVTKTGMMVGTVHYMSPEQIRGQPLDGRSDLFSLGVILFETLAGQRPFTGESSTEVLYKIIQDPTPPLPPEAVQDCSPEMQVVVQRALAKAAVDRYATAAELAEDLSRLLTEHLRIIGKPAPRVADAVQESRRLLRDGQHEAGIACLREAAARHPNSVEVMRVLRTAVRQQVRKEPELERDDTFPELEATFRPESVPTRREPETLLGPTLQRSSQPQTDAAQPVASQPAPAIHRGGARARSPALLAGVGLAIAAAAAAGYLLTREPAALPVSPAPSLSAAPASPSVETHSSPAAGSPPRAILSLPVTSDPPGARVSVDGLAQPGTTPLEVKLATDSDHRLTVSAEGYASQEVRFVRGKIPAQVKITLEPAGPPGRVTVLASYPLDVQWQGRQLVKGQPGAEISLPAGRQVVTLLSPSYFLRVSVQVDVRAGAATSIDAPALGKLSIRANPDNCRVSIDGSFVDYPPILDRSVAVGAHTVSFVWPDGSHREEVVEVARSTPAYVMGRKD